MVLVLSFDGVSTAFSPSDNIEGLNGAKFKRHVLTDRRFWVVLFYLPGCKYWAELALEYRKLALMPQIKGQIKVGAYDITMDTEIFIYYKVNKVPAILFFGANKSHPPKMYEGALTAKALAQAILAEAQKG